MQIEKFVCDANIAKFRKLLTTTTNEDQRLTLLRLLAEEEAKAPTGLPAESGQGQLPSK